MKVSVINIFIINSFYNKNMPPKKVSRKASRKASRKVSHKASRKVSRKASRKSSSKVSRKASRKSSSKASRKVSRKSSRKVSRKASRKVSRKVSRKSSRKVSMKASLKVSRKVSPPKICNSKICPKVSRKNDDKDSKFEKIMKNLKLDLTMNDFPVEFIRVLGEGVFGIVYLVRYNGKLSVLKINKKCPLTRSCSRFGDLKEIYTTIMLSGKKYFPKLIKIFYKNSSDEQTEFFPLSEYFEAENFSNFIKTLHTPQEIEKMVNKIKNMIDWMCENNITHGDLHHGNIMVVKDKNDYELKMVDFGYTTYGEKCDSQFDYMKLLQSLLYYNKPVGMKMADYYEKKFINDKYIQECLKKFKKYSEDWASNPQFLSKCYTKYLDKVIGPGVDLYSFNIKKDSKFIYRTKNSGDIYIDFKKYKEYFQEI